MERRVAISIGLAGALVLGGGLIVYAHRHAPPGCNDARTLDRVTSGLRAQFQLESVLIADVRTVSNGFFGNRYDCTAAVAEIRGGVPASDMHWHAIRYSSVRPGPSPLTVVSVTLGPEVPLPPPSPSFLDRLRNWF